MKYILFVVVSCFLFTCSGPNPNPGERTADILQSQYKYDQSLAIIILKAEKGQPWAQLRLGVAYQLGNGVKKDFDLALKYYKKVAIQKDEGGWANGRIIGSVGKPGFFNQNSDAMVAQYQVATIYLKSDKNHQDLIKAYLWINYVLLESKGQNIFYCCEFSGGIFIPQSMIQQTLSEIKNKMTEKQIEQADLISKTWHILQDT